MSKGCDTCNGSTYTLFEDEPYHCFGCCEPESECTCDIMDIHTGKITPNPRKTKSRKVFRMKKDITLKWCKGCKKYVIEQLMSRGCWCHSKDRQVQEIWR